MLHKVKSVFKTLLDLFVVTQPKLKIEPLSGTEDEAGEVYRLTEQSGVYRDIYVRRRWEKNETTGRDVGVTDMACRVTGYVVIKEIDHEHRSMRGRPTVRGYGLKKKLSREDHDALIEFFEEQDKNRKDADFDTRYVRLYPPIPKDKATAPAVKKALELKL